MPRTKDGSTSGLKDIFQNVGLLLTGKAGAGALSLIYVVIVARTLGAHDYGVLILIHAYTTLVGGIVAFSGWHGIVRFGALALEEKNHERFLKIGRFMTLVEISFGVCAILVAILLIPFVGPHMGWPPEAMRFAIFYSFATLANVRSTPMGVLQLEGRFDLIAAHHVVSPVVRLTGSIIVWLAGGGLIGFLSVWLASAIAEWLGMWFLGLRQLRRMKLSARMFGSIKGTIAENKGLLSFITTTNVDITLRELTPRLVPLTVGWILHPAAAGLFTLSQKASIVLEQPAQMLGQASYSVLARQVAERNWNRLRRTVWRAAGTAALVAIPVVLLLALFGTQLLHLIGGKTFKGGATLLILLASARAISIATPPISSALIAMGQPSRTIAVNLASNLLLFPLLPLLLYWFGLNGAGWQAIIQACFATIAIAFFFRQSVRAQL